METILMLFKIDLGINHELRDEYFIALIKSKKRELEQKGCLINIELIEDQMLLSDYSVWCYRNRTENVQLSNNLKLRIVNKQVSGRAKDKNNV